MTHNSEIVLREPVLEDGMSVYRLVAECPPLDPNSSYCNLLQCSHFSATSVAALSGKTLVGFISAYLIPARVDTLFVWQVAVGKSARGTGLASRMLAELLNRPTCKTIRYLETSITHDNRASWALFRRFAERHSTTLQSTPWMDREAHFCGEHASESLVRLGPFAR